GGDVVAPGGGAQAGRDGDEVAQGAGVEGEHRRVLAVASGVRVQVHSPVVPGPDGAHGGPGAHVGAQAAEVVAERVPQCLREGLGGHVEEQALGGAEEVDVEHQQQFRGGQFARVGEEAAGEHLEREVVGGLGEADGFEEAGGADVVVAGVDVRYADVEEG